VINLVQNKGLAFVRFVEQSQVEDAIENLKNTAMKNTDENAPAHILKMKVFKV
jgi:hypothetical protein